MNPERLMKILVSPYLSEKSTALGEKHNQVVFKVLPDATKTEIKLAVEKLFNVTVTDVTTAHVKGKNKRFKQILGKRSDWKKAFVSLKEGDSIKFVNT
jgi:large subunit ribosomal protein L23